MSLAPAVLVVLLSGAAAAAHTTGPAQVDRVIDGETISVRLADGRRATVRVTGVDTPETRHPTPGVEPGGPAASADTTRRRTGATVRRDRDPAGDDHDADGRILRYVQFSLALMLDAGRGAARDRAGADHWYRLAAAHGHQQAQRMIDAFTVRPLPGPFDPYEPSTDDALLINIRDLLAESLPPRA